MPLAEHRAPRHVACWPPTAAATAPPRAGRRRRFVRRWSQHLAAGGGMQCAALSESRALRPPSCRPRRRRRPLGTVCDRRPLQRGGPPACSRPACSPRLLRACRLFAAAHLNQNHPHPRHLRPYVSRRVRPLLPFPSPKQTHTKHTARIVVLRRQRRQSSSSIVGNRQSSKTADGDLRRRRGQAHAARPRAALRDAAGGGEEPQADRPARRARLQPGAGAMRCVLLWCCGCECV